MSENSTLPVAHSTSENIIDKKTKSRLPYGSAPNIRKTYEKSIVQNIEKRAPHIVDRVHHLEAYTLSFICEHSLPLSFSPRLIEYGKTVSKDPRALKKLQMERSTARYRIVDGLGYISKEDVIKAMQENYFSRRRRVHSKEQ